MLKIIFLKSSYFNIDSNIKNFKEFVDIKIKHSKKSLLNKYKHFF